MHLLCGTPKTETIPGLGGTVPPLPLWELRTHACAYAAVAPLRVNGWIRRENPPLLRRLSTWACFVSVPFIFLKEINFRGVTICLPQRDYT